MNETLSRRALVQGMTGGSAFALAAPRERAQEATPSPESESTKGTAVTITKDEIVALMHAYHELVMIEKGTAAEQSAFFLDSHPRIYIPHGEDLSLEDNYMIHQKLTEESHVSLEPLDVTQLHNQPERARAVGAVLWQGRVVGADKKAVIRCIVGEDWIVQRVPSGDLKIALYINPYHRFLPDSAPFSLR